MKPDLSWSYATPVHHQDRQLALSPPQALLERPDAWVPVGVASDGLPLLLSVNRSLSVVPAVLQVMQARELAQLSDQVRSPLRALDRAIHQERRQLGVRSSGPVGDGPCYLSSSDVRALFGSTLLTRVLGGASPWLLDADRLSAGAPPAGLAHKTCAGVLRSAEARRVIERTLSARQNVVLPLVDGPLSVLKAVEGDAPTLRPAVLERVRTAPSVMFHGRRDDWKTGASRSVEGRVSDEDKYGDALQWVEHLSYSVSRVDLLTMIAQAARSLKAQHDEGLIHGDLKPPNIFVGPEGAFVHDSLDVKEGELASAGTAGWNAPEQVLARPVSPATDVFALGQLVVQVLEGAIFGDERSYVVPVGRGRRERFHVLGDVDVYLDPGLVPLDDEDIAAWRPLLRTCLALEPEQRFASVAAFADELEARIESHPVPGRRELLNLEGELVRFEHGMFGVSLPGCSEGVRPFVARVIRDRAFDERQFLRLMSSLDGERTERRVA